MNQKIDSRVHIALSPGDLTDSYNRHAGVTLLSILKNSTVPITVHILYNKILSIGKEKEEKYNKLCYQKITDEYDCELQYHHVEFPEWINNHPTTKTFPESALMRLMLPTLLPNINRVLYFDCDTVILTDVAELWSIVLDNYYIAACPDNHMSELYNRYKEVYKSTEIIINNYFNSGVLVLNIDKIRRDNINLIEEGLSFLASHPNLPYPDQDFLNYVFGQSYYRLDGRYNLFSVSKNIEENLSNCIIHYAGKDSKPWKRYNGKIDEKYWIYFSLTPWAEDGKIIEYISQILNTNDDSIENVPNVIWEYPIYKKIKTLWELSIPLWIKIIIRYMNS